MRRPRTSAMAIATALVAAMLFSRAGTVGAQQTTFRSAGEPVGGDVAVHDGNKPVTGLMAADFELRDNGVVQTISNLSYATVPIDGRMLVDLSSSIDRKS